jgi:outer membrane protein
MSKGMTMRVWVSLIAAASLTAPASAAAQTLEEALTKAYKNNPTLEAQRLATRQADESYAQALSTFLPRLDLTASAGTRRVDSKSVFGSFVSRSTTETDPNGWGVQASQSLFEGGGRMAQLARVNADIDTSQQGLRAVEQQLLLTGVTAFMNVRRDEEALNIRMANVELLEQQLNAAQERLRVGVLTRTDVAQAEARLAGAMAGVAGARADLEASKAFFQEIIGEAPGPLSAPGAVKGLPATLQEAIDIAIDANPELQAARASERAAKETVKIEGAGLLPSVSLVARYDRSFTEFDGGSNIDTTSATANFSMPLFEGGFARSRTRSAKIGVVRAQAELEEARRAVTADVVESWNNYQATLRVIDASQQQVRANTLALEGVTLEADSGERTTLDVLNARQELLEAQLALVRAERDSYVAGSTLLLSIGRLDAKGLGLSVDAYDPNAHREAVKWRVFSTNPAKP